jgi:hypothetical protein
MLKRRRHQQVHNCTIESSRFIEPIAELVRNNFPLVFFVMMDDSLLVERSSL